MQNLKGEKKQRKRSRTIKKLWDEFTNEWRKREGKSPGQFPWGGTGRRGQVGIKKP